MQLLNNFELLCIIYLLISTLEINYSVFCFNVAKLLVINTNRIY